MCRCICWICGILALLVVLAGSASGQAEPAPAPDTPPAPLPEIPAPAPPEEPPPAPADDAADPPRITLPGGVENLISFSSAEFGLRLQFPDSLRRFEVDQPDLILMLVRPEADPGGMQAQITLTSPQVVRGGLGVEETAKVYLVTFKRTLTEAVVLEQGAASMGGEPAVRVVVQGLRPQDGRPVRHLLLIAMFNDRLYILSAAAEPDAFEPVAEVAERIAATVVWTL